MNQPRLLVVVHTEEEFDWSLPLSRTATATTHIQHLSRSQEIFNAHGIHPIYAIDWPVATDSAAVSILRSLVEQGAVIGTHLHPWVSPPFDETVGPKNSYPGNLSADLEHAKIEMLTQKIATAFDVKPRIYLAGRYGFGPNTGAILQELGYEIDLSFSPPFDFRADGGPDYRGTKLHPSQIDGIWCIPHTGAFIGPLAGSSLALSAWSTKGPLGRVWRGVTGRSGLLQRVRLSPEGYNLATLRRLTKFLLRRGIHLFVFSFHSPSLAPGFTPYVRDEHELHSLLSNVDGYLQWFLNECNGKVAEPDRLVELLNKPTLAY